MKYWRGLVSEKFYYLLFGWLGLLLPDTKLRKNKIQLIFIGDLPRDRSEVMQALPDIQREQVARHFFFQPLLYICQGIT